MRVATAYALVGWVVLQVADVLVPALLLPDWVLTLLVVALGIGLPIAVLVSWNFEITSEGVRRETETDEGHTVAPKKGLALNYVIIGALVLAVSFLLIDRYGVLDGGLSQVARETVSLDRVAVFPFVVRSGNEQLAYVRLTCARKPNCGANPLCEREGRSGVATVRGRNLRPVGRCARTIATG